MRDLLVTVLAENTVEKRKLIAEHGLAFYIKFKERDLLFDTGQGLAIIHNANELGVDLQGLDAVILSHGHDDHTGGLLEVLKQQQKGLKIYAHPDIFQAKFRVRKEAKPLNIGLRWSREELEASGADFQLEKGPREIFPQVWLTGEIPRASGFETIDPGLHANFAGKSEPDPLLDDQALVINRPEGLVVILGCAHAGIINTLIHAQKITGITKIHTVIGGTHLLPADEAQIAQTLNQLKSLGVTQIGVSHCTGPKAAARVSQAFGSSFFHCNVGTKLAL